MKDITKTEYTRRVKKVLQSALDGKNCIQAINTWAVPVVRYEAGIVNWTSMELKEMDRKMRKLMTLH